MLNNVSLLGIVVGTHFHWLAAREGRQAFLCIRLKLRGTSHEKPSVARVVVYGAEAEYIYPRLYTGVMLAVEGRYRIRANQDAQQTLEASLTEILTDIADTNLRQVLQNRLLNRLNDRTQVHEFVASPGGVTLVSNENLIAQP